MRDYLFPSSTSRMLSRRHFPFYFEKTATKRNFSWRKNRGETRNLPQKAGFTGVRGVLAIGNTFSFHHLQGDTINTTIIHQKGPKLTKKRKANNKTRHRHSGPRTLPDSAPSEVVPQVRYSASLMHSFFLLHTLCYFFACYLYLNAVLC